MSAWALLVVALGAWAYGNSLTGVFVLDDVRAIVRNPTIRTLVPLSAPLSPPGQSTVAGRPVANLSFAASYAIAPPDARETFDPGPGDAARSRFERNARAYHLVNVAIHLACALVLLGLVRRTLLTTRMRERFGAAATPIAVAVASLWVVHPLTTAAVTYVVQRVESLMALFYLLTLYCAARAADTDRRRAWTAGAVTACALGMATKEVMVTAPLAVALWDVVFRRGERPRWPLLGGLAATWVVFGVLVSGEYRAASLAPDGVTTWRYLLTQSAVLTHYARLAVFPSGLVFLYDWPLAAGPGDVLLPGLAVLTALTLTSVALVRRHPAAFPAAAALLILAPTSSVIAIVTEVAAEHRMYLPLAALVSLGVTAGFAAAAGSRARRRVAFAAVAVAVCALGSATRARNEVYRSEISLWADTVQRQPAALRARVAYGSALAAARRLPEAERELREAVRLGTGDAVAHARLGSVLAAQGRYDDALTAFERAAALDPDSADAHRGLGQIRAMRGQTAAAVTHLSRAADLIGRRDPQLLELLAASLFADRRPAESRRVLGEALEVARRTGQAEVAARIEKRIRLYDAYGSGR